MTHQKVKSKKPNAASKSTSAVKRKAAIGNPHPMEDSTNEILRGLIQTKEHAKGWIQTCIESGDDRKYAINILHEAGIYLKDLR